MEKISNEQIAEVMADASATLRAQQAELQAKEAENLDLREKLASRDRRDRVVKLAKSLHDKGQELDTPVEELADKLAEHSDQKLAAVEEAVSMMGPDMGSKLAHITNDDQRVSSGSSDFERYINGTIG